MSRGVRLRIARGIYNDASGLAATVKVGRVQKEKRYPLGTDITLLVTWQQKTRGQLLIDQPAQPKAKQRQRRFIRDVARYLKTRKGRAGYAADRAHLQAWVARFGSRARATITRHDILLAFAHWRTTGQRRRQQTIARPLAPRTLRHRYRVLKDLYTALDGPKAPTPLDDIPWPKVPRSVPQDVDIKVIQRVCRTLAKDFPQEHARLLVLATTGRRPVEVMRTVPAKDLNLRRRVWTVPPAKGGEPTQLQLNLEMLAAWKYLIAVDATGDYDTSLYAQRLRRCGWPDGIRPYNVRHALAIDILRRGGDLSDVQAHLGHASIETTRRFYAGILTSREKLTSRLLIGRLPVLPAIAVPAARLQTAAIRSRKQQETRACSVRDSRHAKR